MAFTMTLEKCKTLPGAKEIRYTQVNAGVVLSEGAVAARLEESFLGR